MAQGISEVLTYAIGVSISFLSMVAVILLLLSSRGRVNGTAFLAGWAVTLGVVVAVAYVVFHEVDLPTSTSAADAVGWGRVLFGLLLLLLAVRQWLRRATPPELPKSMASVDTVSAPSAFGLGVVMAGVSPKNLILTVAVGAAVAEQGVSKTDALSALIVFVVVGSLTIAGPVVYYFVRGERATAELDSLKAWLGVHNAAVAIVVLVLLGVDLIAWGLPSVAS